MRTAAAWAGGHAGDGDEAGVCGLGWASDPVKKLLKFFWAKSAGGPRTTWTTYWALKHLIGFIPCIIIS